ncbi:GtrA family protein [Patescibacteria group bacterium]|nr:GtrA family protein [Patescibacteria group bacterium]
MHFFLRHWMRLPLVVRQGVCYGMIGGGSFVLDFFLYLLQTRVFHIYFLVANACSFFIVGTMNFFANRRWTFRHNSRSRLRDYTKFFVIAGVGVVLNTSILGGLVRFFSFHDVVAKIVAAGIVFFWNFGMNRWWTFRARSEPVMALPL